MSSAKTKGKISEGYRTHRGVTGSMIFKSRTFFFLEKRAPGDFGAPGCNPSTLIDLANTALGSKSTLETICKISEGFRANSSVTDSMNFKKIRTFFFGNSCSRDFGGPDCHPSTLIDLAITALANRSTAETI